MPILNQTHDEIHKHLFELKYLNSTQRQAVYDLIQHLSGKSDWYSNSFQRELKALVHNGVISEFERKNLERDFFPDHAW